MTEAATDAFIARWQNASGTVLANAQSFVAELAVLLGAERPDPAQADTADNAYVFERRVIFRHGDGGSSEGRIDCYKRGCFVLEAKMIKVTANSPFGADKATASKTTALQGGRARDALFAVADGATPLNSKEKQIHERGLVGVLKSLHDELDAAVLDAYGWTDQPTDASLLERLVQLNSERLAEEAQGHIRWLRPDYQAPASASVSNATPVTPGVQSTLLEAETTPPAPSTQHPAANAATWPSTLPEQLAAIAKLLTATTTPQTEAQLAQHFSAQAKPSAKLKSRLPDLLAALAALGRARRLDDGRWMR